MKSLHQGSVKVDHCVSPMNRRQQVPQVCAALETAGPCPHLLSFHLGISQPFQSTSSTLHPHPRPCLLHGSAGFPLPSFKELLQGDSSQERLVSLCMSGASSSSFPACHLFLPK